MDAQITVKDKIAGLNKNLLAIMILIAKDYKYQEVAAELNLDSKPMFNQVCDLYTTFGLSIEKWEAGYDELARLGRENGLLTAKALGEIPLAKLEDGISPNNEGEDMDGMDNASSLSDKKERMRRIRQSRKPSGGAVMPVARDVAYKISELKPRQLDHLKVMVKSGRNDRNALADAEGISPAAITARNKKVYSELGIPNGKGRKKLLCAAWDFYQRNLQPDSATDASETAHENNSAPSQENSEVAYETGAAAKNGRVPAQVPVVVAPHTPASQSSPAMLVRPEGAGAFLVQPPPGAKRITITIDL